MKSSEILTRAAELVDSGDYELCWKAVDAACKSQRVFDATFEYFAQIYGYLVVCADQQHRVLALLLCAAIAESEGD